MTQEWYDWLMAQVARIAALEQHCAALTNRCAALEDRCYTLELECESLQPEPDVRGIIGHGYGTFGA